MTELKACPFCGGAVKYNYDIELVPIGVACHRCKMVARFMRVKRPGPREPMGEAMETIAKQWNRRSR